MKSSFLPAYSLSLLIFIVASLPGSGLKKIQRFPDNAGLRFLLSDQFMHFLTFGVLTLLTYYGYERSIQYKARNKSKECRDSGKAAIPYLKICLIPAGYGVLIEIYQAVLPYRSFGLDDILWNLTGVGAFSIMIFCMKFILRPGL